jgi:hypothetical protein
MSDRPAPLLPNILLALGFLVFLIVGILTVLVPALAGDDETEANEGAPAAVSSPSGDASE